MPLEPQSRALFESIRAAEANMPAEIDPALKREMHRRFGNDLAGPPPPVERIQDLVVAGRDAEIPIRLYNPKPARTLPALVWFHGGGHVTGDLDTHDTLCRMIAARVPCVVVNVDYRLAPEHRFPAAFDDAYAATSWAVDNATEIGADPERMAVGGSSSGGNLAAAVALAARDRGAPKLACQLLVYPVLDMTFSAESHRTHATGYYLTTAKVEWARCRYVGPETDLKHPYLSPLWAGSFAGLPPAHIITAELDPLRDDGQAFAARLEAAGVEVVASDYPGVMHGFFSQSGVLDRGKAAIKEACDILRLGLA